MNFSFYLLYNLILVIQYSVCSSKLFFFWYKNRYFVIYTFIIYIIYIFYIRVLNKFYFVFGQRYFFFTLKNSSTQKIIGVEKNCIGRRWVRSEPFALKYWEGGWLYAVILFLGPLDIELQCFAWCEFFTVLCIHMYVIRLYMWKYSQQAP